MKNPNFVKKIIFLKNFIIILIIEHYSNWDKIIKDYYLNQLILKYDKLINFTIYFYLNLILIYFDYAEINSL